MAATAMASVTVMASNNYMGGKWMSTKVQKEQKK